MVVAVAWATAAGTTWAQTAVTLPPDQPIAALAEFAAGDRAPVRFSGFVDGLAAYIYEDPKHWSRAVGRL